MSKFSPLSILIVEDEALIALELQYLIDNAGHTVAGWATNLTEADEILHSTELDLALVDINLADGPSGTVVAHHLLDHAISVIFMTANAKRIPEDFAGAIGVMAKPYTASGVAAALSYLHSGVRNPPPSLQIPSGLRLSPRFAKDWSPA